MSHILKLQTISLADSNSEFENFLASTTSTICPDGITGNNSLQPE